MKNKKTLIICIVAIVALVCVTVGISLAFFNYAGTGTTDNTLETGSITFLYTETSTVGRGINITDAFPISNEEGKALLGEGNVFDFKVEGTKLGNKKIDYEITARKSDESTLDEDIVIMYLTKVNGIEEKEVLLDKYNNLTQTDKTNSYIEKTLRKETIYAGDNNYSQDYRLRMWITNDGSFTTDDMGKTFIVTVNVYANAEVVTENQIALENNTKIENVSVNNNPVEISSEEGIDYYINLEEDTTTSTLEIETTNPEAKIEVENITNRYAYTSIIKKLSTQITLNNLINGDNYFNIKVISENGKVEDESILKVYVGKLCEYDIGQVWNFDYTGGEQEFTVPCSGTYKLETWGAQGGNFGGTGGYSSGNITLNTLNPIYITVGSTTNNQTGGYNGGGAGGNSIYSKGYGGGGATHMSYISGLLSSLNSNITDLIIVAGGGGAKGSDINGYVGGAGGVGGGSSSTAGGNGSNGARNGSAQTPIGGKASNQLSAGSSGSVGCGYDSCGGAGSSGSFGQGGSGGNGAAPCSIWPGGSSGGGGAGLYGGGGGGGGAGNAYCANGATQDWTSAGAGGAGGSGYIGNSLLTDKVMYCYNCSTSNEESTKTVSTTCRSSTPTENCAKEGNGYARITLVSIY